MILYFTLEDRVSVSKALLKISACMQRTDTSCFFFRVSLESRDLLDLLVSVDPPDLLDPLDCLVLLERLVVRYEASIGCLLTLVSCTANSAFIG